MPDQTELIVYMWKKQIKFYNINSRGVIDFIKDGLLYLYLSLELRY